jgi:hypothetical protein
MLWTGPGSVQDCAMTGILNVTRHLIWQQNPGSAPIIHKAQEKGIGMGLWHGASGGGGMGYPPFEWPQGETCLRPPIGKRGAGRGETIRYPWPPHAIPPRFWMTSDWPQSRKTRDRGVWPGVSGGIQGDSRVLALWMVTEWDVSGTV